MQFLFAWFFKAQLFARISATSLIFWKEKTKLEWHGPCFAINLKIDETALEQHLRMLSSVTWGTKYCNVKQSSFLSIRLPNFLLKVLQVSFRLFETITTRLLDMSAKCNCVLQKKPEKVCHFEKKSNLILGLFLNVKRK